MPASTNLQPPYLSGLIIDRFSPYFQRPSDYGIELLGPRPDYALIYPVPADVLDDLAYKFDHRLKNGADPQNYVRPLQTALEAWQSDHSGKPCGGLIYRRGEGFVLIEDRRCMLEQADHTLTGPVAAVFLQCDSGARPSTVLQKLQHRFPSLTMADVERVLAMLCEMRLIFQEDSRFLSLALPANPEVQEEDLVEPAPGVRSPALTRIG